MERKKGSFQNSPLIATTSNVVRLECFSMSPYQLVALQGKKGNKPAKVSNLSLTDLRVPVPMVPMVPIPFALAVAPPGVHIMPSPQRELPISRSQHVKCHQSAV